MKNKYYGKAVSTLFAIVALVLTLSVGAAAAPSQPAGAKPEPQAQPLDTQYFQDIPVGSFFYPFTAVLYQQGVVSGFACGAPPAGSCVPPNNLPYYVPSGNVTRGQMSIFINNARTKPGIKLDDTSVSAMQNISSTNHTAFADNVYIRSYGPANYGINVRSQDSYGIYASSGANNAIYATTTYTGGGNEGVAIFGETEADNGTGVKGAADGLNAYGVYGDARFGPGVYGNSDNSFGGAFDTANYTDTYGIKSVDGGASLTGAAADLYVGRNATIAGDLTVGGTKTGYVSDIVRNDSGRDLHPGEIASASGSEAAAAILGTIPVANVAASSKAYDTAILGVVDRKWVLGDSNASEGSKAREGRYEAVEVIHPGEYMNVVTLGAFHAIKVDASKGAIHAGDMLVSDGQGGAMKADDNKVKVGSVIGKALGNLSSGTGYVPVMVTVK